MAYDNENVFAKILRGELPNATVYEDESILAFNDIAPQMPVHVLVIPKRPYIDINDFSANGTIEEIGNFFAKVGEIARSLGLDEDGYRVVSNNGENAGQHVPHFHVHILGGRKIKEGGMARGM
ncbi:MAG: histidine triad nucleotide-binding protein [Sneathiella sp.]|uniref:histidine triad nucleotide-binding protein n=1 Tax=Sneathiella sp. TaxID=1964365 RepID=UPI000C350A38|nr:histidine triad nucleotide-binding protein [Sneathiella sp.]MAL79357.1 histidine triad nucleotide-binding protein [Sneathiella sp.]|tara:strand:- start:329 stop:697 length:369 start_codon:yes stop_codon:yes gene_type:complete